MPATPSVRTAVALDGGTTNTRARLWKDGCVLKTARRAVGVRDQVLAGSALSLPEAVRDVIAEVLADEPGPPDVVVAAGMLTADVGLVPVPHVLAPAGLAELSEAAVERRLPEICDRPILFIPGVRTPPRDGTGGWAYADVMRGEECETIGAWLGQADRSACQFFWPGSHSKFVSVDPQGRIGFSLTTLAGELTTALARHTLLAASLPETLPDRPDPESLRLGMEFCREHGLARSGFLVRLGQLLQTLPEPHHRASFWIGAVIQNDLSEMMLDPRLDRGRPLYVGGRQPQRGLYSQGFKACGFERVDELTDEQADGCSAAGAVAVASRRLRG